MPHDDLFDIFLVTTPGLESVLAEEVRGTGFKRPKTVPGGVVIKGGWPEVWRANLWVRGATRVLARIGSFRAEHMAQLDKNARRFDWAAGLRADVPFRVEATCHKSRLYHTGAVVQRLETAIHDTLGAPQDPEAAVTIKARLEHDLCTLSVDTSGDLLHKRGFKEAVNQAPMRETMAALFLMQCGFDGHEPVLDPMCGSGTFVIEAAEMAARLNPGRGRSFAFEQLATFDPQAWQRMRDVTRAPIPSVHFYGSDRDAGAIKMSRANAERAGVADRTTFEKRAISEIAPPEGPPGLVFVNPPYGLRLGNKKELAPLYRAMGQVLLARFAGWRVGIITTDSSLARATGLPFLPPPAPVQHGGARVTLWRTEALS